MKKYYVLGADFGSDSVRALIVDARTGMEIASSIAEYPRWKAGKYQDAQKHMFRQHPLDYIEALTACVRVALHSAGEDVRRNIAAISVDTTGSTPCPVNKAGVPLALLPEFQEDPDAMFHLWKDHTAVAEAEEITAAFAKNPDGVDYTQFQGAYASEWFWAKILHTSRTNPKIQECAYAWVEHSDWIPSLLCGDTQPETMYRCACAAGHKAYWHSAWGGLPSERCLAQLDDCLVRVRRTYGAGPKASTVCLGTICAEWAQRFGLEEDVLIGGSSFDAHAGAVGAGVNADTVVVNLGTSAVDMLVADAKSVVSGQIARVCGMAENSIIPGMVGLESGQAAFGDVYAWFSRLLMWPLRNMPADILPQDAQKQLIDALESGLLPALQRQAEAIDPEDAPVALDWFNGRRYPCVNETVHSAISDVYMGTDAPAMYRALVTATALGQKRIIEALEREGVKPSRIVAVGGIAQKSSLLMETLASALGKTVCVSKSKQACARGAAMYAAVAAGIYRDLSEAQAHMCEGFQHIYAPDPSMHARYERIYAKYLQLSTFVDPNLAI